MTRRAVLLCGHGSRDAEGVREFKLAAAALRRRLAEFDFAAGYLEFARPTIREALAGLAARGAQQILAVPAMLLAASHVKDDLPREIAGFTADYPGTDVRLGRDLGTDAKLLYAAADRIAAAIADATMPRGDILLAVVGRGAHDPDANASIAKLAGTLQEGMDFGAAETAFSGIAHPRVDAMLTRAAGLGFRRIVVFPYFLFTGVLVKRIYAQTDAVARLFPQIEFVKAPCLRGHPAVLDLFCDRVGELAVGPSRAMNCQPHR